MMKQWDEITPVHKSLNGKGEWLATLSTLTVVASKVSIILAREGKRKIQLEIEPVTF